ncbi:exocyst complex component [Niveomyces insectorum RCEF 264]|uniref:Exocyst complex component n=1 Tax=Niveomyces insectorum RCEF 264 TaxID=1081102 RepID=A0A167PWD6_9HYPO|nr:exocyst complex component [Niveomyces insectorum RCEF 264]
MATPNGREMTRAERFEDEKRRIIDSCFNKTDEDGSIIETYITHIKILEYSSHPTSPPPPQARTPQSEKHRVIIVAVRKSGRVRVHKSKENPNGTFSIGKTWDLNDLSAIESYTSPNASPDFRQWAGNVGFVITLGKPYYWQAQTDKEKKFFIASLLKIYGKYSGGKVPTIVGFDQYELDQIQGGAGRRVAPPPVAAQPQPQPPPPPQAQAQAQAQAQFTPPLPPPPLSAREPVSAASATASSASNYGSMGSTDFRNTGGVPRSAMLASGAASPATSIDSGRSATQAAALRRLAGSNKSQESVAASMTARSDDGSISIPSRSRNANGPVNGTGAYGLADSPAIAEGKPPPERKRPPMDPSRPQGQADDGLVPAPLMSSTRSRDGAVLPPPRNSNRSSPYQDAKRAAMDPGAPPSRTPTNGSFPNTASSTPPPRLRRASPSAESAAGAPEQQSSSATPSALVQAQAQESAPPPVPPIPTEEPVDTRPGLGPMIKKKSKGDIASAFWKAASAANAFKPRPGGAGERLRQAQTRNDDGPDGITGVVPAPPRPVSVEKSKPTLEEPPKTPERSSIRSIPEVKVTIPTSSRPASSHLPTNEVASKLAATAAEEPPAEDAVISRKSVIAGNDAKYLATLGVDPTIIDKRSAEFAKWLDYFGWVPGEHMRSVNMEDLKVDVDRELDRAQAGGWLSRFRAEDERVEAIKKGVDVAIDECEELDNLLTLYSVELSTLSDDIAFIEAQGQGLQVQAANQKLLMKELESLLDTCAITSNDLEALRTAPLESTTGIGEIESALVTLYKAMSKIDPSRGNPSATRGQDASSEEPAALLHSDFGQMRVVREKKEMYAAESNAFMRRLVIFMASELDKAFAQTRRAMEGALAKKVDPRNHDVGRDLLWKYSPLMFYAREADLTNWDRILQIYQDTSHPLYKTEFRGLLNVWKKNARKPTGDDSEILFTSLQEKKEEGLATTARKLTVKRSQTLARSLRSPLGDGGSGNSSRTSLDKMPNNSLTNGGGNRSHPYEIFASVLDELLPLVQMEQNFVIDMFHATTLQQEMDFADVVAAAPPSNRRGGDLRRNRPMEPDRALARRVTRAMEAIFSFFEQDLQGLIDWVLSMEALQGIGVLATLERKLADISQSNQEFLSNLLQKLHGNLEGRFRKFVDEQIRAIEETKVKIKKRKGVIGFMRIFPHFSMAVENMLADVDPALSVRRTVDGEYDRLLQSMFDALKVIARENPTMTVAAAGAADPEDKEALNFHILLIENMNHYLEDVENPRGNPVLDRWKAAAAAELREHLGLYLNAVMRRPLGKLLEHLENLEAQLASGKSPSAVAAQPSNTKAMFNKVLSGYDAKEVRKGIDTLRKRVEKHFSGGGDDDFSGSLAVGGGGSGGGGGGAGGGGGSGFGSNSSSSGSSKALVARVLRECESFYGGVEMRINRITTDVYGGDVLYEWPRAEVKQAFSTAGLR